MNTSTPGFLAASKRLFLLLLFLSTTIVKSSVKEFIEDVKKYGIVNFVTDIGAPAFLSVLSFCKALDDFNYTMPTICYHHQKVEHMITLLTGIQTCIKDKNCGTPNPVVTYLEFGVSGMCGIYTIYNVWKFNRKSH